MSGIKFETAQFPILGGLFPQLLVTSYEIEDAVTVLGHPEPARFLFVRMLIVARDD